MPLSREDFLNATPDNPPQLPPEVFGPPPSRGPEWPDNPDLRAALDWFKAFMTEEEWHARAAWQRSSFCTDAPMA